MSSKYLFSLTYRKNEKEACNNVIAMDFAEAIAKFDTIHKEDKKEDGVAELLVVAKSTRVDAE